MKSATRASCASEEDAAQRLTSKGGSGEVGLAVGSGRPTERVVELHAQGAGCGGVEAPEVGADGETVDHEHRSDVDCGVGAQIEAPTAFHAHAQEMAPEGVEGRPQL